MSQIHQEKAAPYTAFAVANAFLAIAHTKGEKLTPMKLQKLVYYAHGWNLALADRPLIDESVEAWTWGPVIKSLYHELKQYGDKPVQDYCSDPDSLSGDVFVINAGDSFTKDLLDEVWRVYGKYTAIQLSNMSHIDNSPWDRIKQQYGCVPHSAIIKDDLIKEYFSSIAERRLNA